LRKVSGSSAEVAEIEYDEVIMNYEFRMSGTEIIIVFLKALFRILRGATYENHEKL
jgi:hypothetical protein